MADEIRRSGSRSASPELVRSEVETTRARMVSTIDEIVGVLRRKKERLESQLDVFRRVRERPVAAVGLVFGAGLLLGFLTGGEEEPRRAAGTQAELWERRARRMRRLARTQEAELNRLREAAWRDEAIDAEIEDGMEDDIEDETEADGADGRGTARGIEEEGTHRLSAFIRDGMQRMIRRRTA